MIFQWWFIEHVCKIWWTFRWFIEHSLCWEMWQDKSHYIFVNICKDNVHNLEWSDLYYSSIMTFKFNISLNSSCEKSVMWSICQHKISWFCNDHWSHSNQNMTTMFSQANHSMLYKEVDIITWLRDIVQHELNINKYIYMHLLSKLQTQMTTLDLLEKKLNTVKAKAVLWWEFIIIYCEFNNVFCNVLKSWKNKCLTFLIQQCNYNKWRQIKEKWIFKKVEDHDSASAFNVSQSFDTSFFSYIDDEKSESLKTV